MTIYSSTAAVHSANTYFANGKFNDATKNPGIKVIFTSDFENFYASFASRDGRDSETFRSFEEVLDWLTK